MKKKLKLLTVLLVLAGICTVCGMATSCTSTETSMYKTQHSDSKVINQNLKVKGTNRSNSATYRNSF